VKRRIQPDLRVELIDGSVIGYAEAGDPAGFPLLYLHGSPSSRLEVELPGIGEAAQDLRIRVIAPDRPGMGLTAFFRYSIADYPLLVQGFADALGDYDGSRSSVSQAAGGTPARARGGLSSG